MERISMDEFEAMILKMQRTGEIDKARWLQNIDQKIPSLFKQKIIDNDKSVLRELILPGWLTWDILRIWAMRDVESSSCIFCQQNKDEGAMFKGHFVCVDCYNELVKKE